MHSLQLIGEGFKTDKATRHRYCETYEQLLPREVSELWEIGVLRGASLNMWAAYYPDAKILGFDIVDTSGIEFLPNVETHLLDQSNIYALNALGDTRGIDVIIDDASHNVMHQISTFEALFDCLKSGGKYIIEDLHTSTDLWTGFGYKDGKGALQYLEDIAAYKMPTGYPGQHRTEKVIEQVEQVIIVANCDTPDRRSLTSIITHK